MAYGQHTILCQWYDYLGTFDSCPSEGKAITIGIKCVSKTYGWNSSLCSEGFVYTMMTEWALGSLSKQITLSNSSHVIWLTVRYNTQEAPHNSSICVVIAQHEHTHEENEAMLQNLLGRWPKIHITLTTTNRMELCTTIVIRNQSNPCSNCESHLDELLLILNNWSGFWLVLA